MNEVPATTWHRESWDHLLNERLPQLLSERLPLEVYRIEPAGPDTCRVVITLTTAPGAVEADFTLPVPDERGVFTLNDRPYVIVPLATTDDPGQAEILCAGEQFHAFLADRLGHAPGEVEWDAERLHVWLPLEEWTREFMGVAQPLDTTNAISVQCHLRRIILPERRRMSTPGHLWRTCPFETPEGPNIGRVLSISRGAAVRDGRLVVTDDRPEVGLGATASMVPFIEHNDPARLVMAVNMIRQWMPPPDPEPALVQTGCEPEDPVFWCGRNLLTAYVHRGCDTFEDAILISESCARRLGYPVPVQPGDKLSNRSGNKGVISRIVPDDEMPHLEDGTPVELCFSPLSLYSRLTAGQLKEAAISWVAKREGKPVIAPPLHAPKTETLKEMLARAGLSESGQRTLRDGRDGGSMPFPATVGWVYWGRLVHRSDPKLTVSVTPARGQREGEPEFHALMLAGATETVREQFHTRASENPGADDLAARLTAGPVKQAAPPAPRFARLQRRLAAAGIRVDLVGENLTFRLAPPEGETLTLPAPMPHPWLPEQLLTQVGARPKMPEYRALAAASEKLQRLAVGVAPESLRRHAQADLEARARSYFDALIRPDTLTFSAKVIFSGRAVSVPDGDLRYEQVGIPETMAWTLFGPVLTRETGDADAVQARTPEAAGALDALMARSWVLLNRVTVAPAPFVAFRPVRCPDPVLRIHPFTCRLLDSDFDGDELAVFLPVTEAGQREAGEKLTVAAWVERELSTARPTRPLLDARYGPFLLNVRPIQDARFGLAWLATTPEGHAEIERLAGVTVPLEDGVLTGNSLTAVQQALLERDGVTAMLEAMEQLTVRGYEAAKASGASLSPFPSVPVEPPASPVDDDPDAWNAYVEEYQARIMAHYADPATSADPAKLTLMSGARGTIRLWTCMVGLKGVVRGMGDTLVPIKHGYAAGLTPDEVMTDWIGMREGLARGMDQFLEVQREGTEVEPVGGYGVLARAMRARQPGVVFARAAAAGETDPLDTPVARLFVGLPA